MIGRNIFLLLLVGILLATGCTAQETTIEQITNADLNDITKIVFIDGTTGEQIETEHQLKIHEFTVYLRGFMLRKSEEQVDLSGYPWAADLYQDDEIAFRVTFLSPLNINGTYYELLDPGLDIEAIDRFITTLPSL